MSNPLIIGHRGDSAHAPENTLLAFDLAVAGGCDGLEFDVRLASDGVPVIIHDPDLRRTAGQPGAVRSMTSTELGKIDAGSWFNKQYPHRAAPQFARARLPLLSEVLGRYSGSRLVLYVELKCSKAEAGPLASVVVTMLHDHDVARNAIVESFDLDAIRQVKQIDASIRTAALFEPTLRPRSLSIGRIIEDARAVRADQIALHHSLLTASRATRIIDVGLEIAVWTVDKPRWIPFALEHKVTALITNTPHEMVVSRDLAAS